MKSCLDATVSGGNRVWMKMYFTDPKVGPRRVEEAQNFSLFFPSPAPMFALSSLSGGLLVEFWWCAILPALLLRPLPWFLTLWKVKGDGGLMV